MWWSMNLKKIDRVSFEIWTQFSPTPWNTWRLLPKRSQIWGFSPDERKPSISWIVHLKQMQCFYMGIVRAGRLCQFSDLWQAKPTTLQRHWRPSECGGWFASSMTLWVSYLPAHIISWRVNFFKLEKPEHKLCLFVYSPALMSSLTYNWQYDRGTMNWVLCDVQANNVRNRRT